MTEEVADKGHDELADRGHRFVGRLYAIASAVMATLGLFLSAVDIVFDQPLEYFFIAVVMVLISVVTFVCVRRKLLFVGGVTYLVGISLILIVSIYLSPYLKGEIVAGLALIIVLSGFTLKPIAAVYFGGVNLALYIAAYTLSPYEAGQAMAAVGQRSLAAELVLPVGLIALFASVVYIIANHATELRVELTERLLSIESFVPRITDSGTSLSHAAHEIHVLANQQKAGASQQSAAIAQVRQALQSLLDASVKIAEVAKNVETNAVETLQNNEQAAVQFSVLAKQVGRIKEIVEIIKSIANKSELLALNAALEGTRAGEVGRGFSLVAGQMQKLTENVMQSLNGIEGITHDISLETNATQLSTDAAIRLAHSTTEAGREIALITQQQRSSTEQIATTMQDITVVSKQVAEGSKQALESTARLHEFASKLPELLGELQRSSSGQ